MYFYAAPISHFLRGKNPIKTTDFTALHPRQVSKIRFHFPFISWLNYNTGKKKGLFLVLVEPRPSFRSLIGHFVLRLCTRPRKQSDHWLMKYFFFLTHKHTHLITLNSQIQLFEQIEKFYTLVIKTVTGIMACTLTGPHTLNLQSFDCIPPLPATSSTHTNRQSMSWFVSQFLQAFSDCLLHNKPHINMQQLHNGRRERKRKKRKRKESIKLPTKIAHYDWNRRWFSSSKNIINGAPQTQTCWLHRKTHPSTFQVMRDETMTHPWVLHLLKMSLFLTQLKAFRIIKPHHFSG